MNNGRFAKGKRGPNASGAPRTPRQAHTGATQTNPQNDEEWGGGRVRGMVGRCRGATPTPKPPSYPNSPSSYSGTRWRTSRTPPRYRTAPRWSSRRRWGMWCHCPDGRTGPRRRQGPPTRPAGPQRGQLPAREHQRPLEVAACEGGGGPGGAGPERGPGSPHQCPGVRTVHLRRFRSWPGPLARAHRRCDPRKRPCSAGHGEKLGTRQKRKCSRLRHACADD